MDPRVGRGSGWPRFDGHCCRTLAHSGARLFTGIRFEHRRSLRFGDEFRGRRGGGRRVGGTAAFADRLGHASAQQFRPHLPEEAV